MTGIRFEHPQWIAENCTACGNCCHGVPGHGIPGLVNEVARCWTRWFPGAEKRPPGTASAAGGASKLEQGLRGLLGTAAETDPVGCCRRLSPPPSTPRTWGGRAGGAQARVRLVQRGAGRFGCPQPTLLHPAGKEGGRQRRPAQHHRQPYTCKGLHGVRGGLRGRGAHPGAPDRRDRCSLASQWDFWLDLPTTPQKYIRVDDLEQGIGALETILLDKEAWRHGQRRRRLPGLLENRDAPVRRHRWTSLMQPRVRPARQAG